jgi:hypothetical protein
MKKPDKYRHTLFIYSLMLSCIFLLVKCINNENAKNETAIKTKAAAKNISYEEFAGIETCAHCHKNISEDYMHTAHYLTSAIASEKTVKGNFISGKNSFAYSADRVVRLEKRVDSLYQVYYYKGDERVVRRFDIAVGSGIKGQTYLSWVDSQLIELPVSYFTMVHHWANSPGYPLYPTLFNRPATSRCLECHTTFATLFTPPFQEPEKFDKSKMIYHITCEKCHGPGAKHVMYQTQNPNDTVGRFIVNPSRLSKALNMDLCNLCHSGRLQKTKPSFEFVAGDTLSEYFKIDSLTQSVSNIDVHGNQYGLLAASKCFKISKTMTCLTCHDVHKNERGKMEIFSERCMTCHTEKHKTIDGLSNVQMSSNCIDCHMPVQSSMSIAFLLQGETIPTHAMMRTHFITIYSDETKKFLTKLKSANKNH